MITMTRRQRIWTAIGSVLGVLLIIGWFVWPSDSVPGEGMPGAGVTQVPTASPATP